MTDGAPLKVSFRAPFASRMGMKVELSDDVSSLEFSPDLAGILGFDADVKYSGHNNNNNNNNNNNRISIPPSVVTSEAVKDDSTGGRRRVGRQNVERICQTSNSYGYKKKAPLLRIVDRPSDIKGIEHNIMNPVQYVRYLSKRSVLILGQ